MKHIITALLFSVCSNLSHADIISIKGDKIDLDSGWVHLAFFDIWASYGDQQPQTLLASFPESYQSAIKKVWLQPKFNITEAQALGFQKAFPTVQPIVLDDNFALMRQYGLWELPAHVILRDGKQVFKGDNKQLSEFISSAEF